MTRNHQQPQEQQPKPAQEHLAKQVGTGHGSDTTNNKTTQETKTMQTADAIQMIPLNQLFRSALNVRKGGSGDVSELAASIKANGLIQNLVVIPEKKGKREGFGVVAGGRRLEALESLCKAGVVDGEKLIPCMVAAKSEAVELSTSENVVREAMHPADEFAAFAEMIAKGKTAEQVAERFGITVRRVVQRMKLAKLSPKVLAAYRANDLTLDVVEAFTLTDDHKAQEALLKTRHLSAYSVRNALSGEAVRERDYRVVFVGEEAYTAAGGMVRPDLFSDARYYENPEILDTLTAEKLEKTADKLRKKFAWVDVEPKADWRSSDAYCSVPMIDGEASPEVAAQLEAMRAEVARLDAIMDSDEDDDGSTWDAYSEAKDKLRKLEDSTKIPHPDGAALAGAVVLLKDSGKVEILRGVIRKADRAKLAKKAGGGEQGGEETDSEAGEADPNTVRIDLTAFATGVAQVETAKNIPVALRLLAYQLARTTVRHAYTNVVEVRASSQDHLIGNSPTLQASPVAAELEALDEQWSKELPEEDADLLAWCLAAEDAKVNALLAYATARTINGVENFPGTARTVAPILTALSVDLRQHWTPAASYFARIKKRDTLRILADHGHAGPELAKMKRDALAGRAAELLQGTGWLPPSIR